MDKHVLMELYESTGGASWKRNDNWGSDKPLRTWYGVKVDDSGNVTSLQLPNNNLRGKLPESITQLLSLEYIRLSSNHLSGPIPTSIGSLVNLQYLLLYDNRLNGSIPDHIGQLHKLVMCYLHANNLSGSIPRTIGNLDNLVGLDLSSNQLSGPIPDSLDGLRNLNILYLFCNRLTGSIPTSLFTIGNLHGLDLSSNLLSGQIPTNMSKLTKLTFLNLHFNRLDGQIPDSISLLTKLQTCDFSCNQLNGYIPESVEHMTCLTDLRLWSNKLEGEIPLSMKALKKLKRLELSGNSLSGCIPDIFAEFCDMEKLTLDCNQLTGYLPLSLDNLSKLKCFDVSFNDIDGYKDEIDALKVVFDSLTGSTWTNSEKWHSTGDSKERYGLSVNTWRHVDTLRLPHNNLQGSLPEAINKLVHLRDLTLAGNVIQGSIPCLEHLSCLQYLRLQSCQLNGNIPDSLGSIPTLRQLWLFENDLSGPLPQGLGALVNLESLDVSCNNLIGHIPESYSGLTALKHLGLEGNQISGGFTNLLDLVNIHTLKLDQSYSVAFNTPVEFTHIHDVLVFARAQKESLRSNKVVPSMQQMKLVVCGASGHVKTTIIKHLEAAELKKQGFDVSDNVMLKAWQHQGIEFTFWDFGSVTSTMNQCFSGRTLFIIAVDIDPEDPSYLQSEYESYMAIIDTLSIKSDTVLVSVLPHGFDRKSYDPKLTQLTLPADMKPASASIVVGFKPTNDEVQSLKSILVELSRRQDCSQQIHPWNVDMLMKKMWSKYPYSTNITELNSLVKGIAGMHNQLVQITLDLYRKWGMINVLRSGDIVVHSSHFAMCLSRLKLRSSEHRGVVTTTYMTGIIPDFSIEFQGLLLRLMNEQLFGFDLIDLDGRRVTAIPYLLASSELSQFKKLEAKYSGLHLTKHGKLIMRSKYIPTMLVPMLLCLLNKFAVVDECWREGFVLYFPGSKSAIIIVYAFDNQIELISFGDLIARSLVTSAFIRLIRTYFPGFTCSVELIYDQSLRISEQAFVDCLKRRLFVYRDRDESTYPSPTRSVKQLYLHGLHVLLEICDENIEFRQFDSVRRLCSQIDNNLYRSNSTQGDFTVISTALIDSIPLLNSLQCITGVRSFWLVSKSLSTNELFAVCLSPGFKLSDPFFVVEEVPINIVSADVDFRYQSISDSIVDLVSSIFGITMANWDRSWLGMCDLSSVREQLLEVEKRSMIETETELSQYFVMKCKDIVATKKPRHVYSLDVVTEQQTKFQEEFNSHFKASGPLSSPGSTKEAREIVTQIRHLKLHDNFRRTHKLIVADYARICPTFFFLIDRRGSSASTISNAIDLFTNILKCLSHPVRATKYLLDGFLQESMFLFLMCECCLQPQPKPTAEMYSCVLTSNEYPRKIMDPSRVVKRVLPLLKASFFVAKSQTTESRFGNHFGNPNEILSGEALSHMHRFWEVLGDDSISNYKGSQSRVESIWGSENSNSNSNTNAVFRDSQQISDHHFCVREFEKYLGTIDIKDAWKRYLHTVEYQGMKYFVCSDCLRKHK